MLAASFLFLESLVYYFPAEATAAHALWLMASHSALERSHLYLRFQNPEHSVPWTQHLSVCPWPLLAFALPLPTLPSSVSPGFGLHSPQALSVLSLGT